MQTLVDGDLVDHAIVLTRTNSNPNGCGTWEVTQGLRLYTDAAIVTKAGVLGPRVLVSRHYGSGEGIISGARVVISGRLVPVGQE